MTPEERTSALLDGLRDHTYERVYLEALYERATNNKPLGVWGSRDGLAGMVDLAAIAARLDAPTKERNLQIPASRPS